MLDIVREELIGGLPDVRELVRMCLRLLAALAVGAVIGLQRELTGKPAGLRTHMLVALGTTLFVIAGVEAGMGAGSDAMSRVVQGVATGIGFLGGGAILKLTHEQDIKGLTTAAGIWMTAAAGVAIGMGQLGVALIAVVLGWLVLSVLGRIERRIDEARRVNADDGR